MDKNSKVSVYHGLGDAGGLAGQVSAGDGRILTANGCCGVGSEDLGALPMPRVGIGANGA